MPEQKIIRDHSVRGLPSVSYGSVAYQHIEPLSKQLTIVVGLTVVGFMAFGLALSFYRNVLFEQTLSDIRSQNNALKGSIIKGYRELEYYRSSQFKDKYAKENLGVVEPGEKVLIITEKQRSEATPDETNTTYAEEREAAYLELLHQMPVIEHWKLFFFHRDQLEELKRAL
jgi:cell division protein FtsB